MALGLRQTPFHNRTISRKTKSDQNLYPINYLPKKTCFEKLYNFQFVNKALFTNRNPGLPLPYFLGCREHR